ncbi:hypothetical protein BKI52_06785 [marine bacterium AO1-C]|nr:hypothetical protein BKI52_06785 [marine bacterium AO1-C]
MTTMQKDLSKTNDTKKQQQADQQLIQDLEMNITKLDLAPDFEEQLEAFPLLRKLWEQIQQRSEEADQEDA